MLPPGGMCRLAAAKDKGVSSRIIFQLRVVLRAVATLAFLVDLDGTSREWTIGLNCANAAASPLAAPAAEASSSPSSPVGVEGASTADALHQQQTASLVAREDGGDGGPAFRAISYGTCSMPLAVGGEIVRCDSEGGGRPHVEFHSFEGPQGPLLNQSFPMDIPPDFFLRRTMARDRREMMKQKNALTDSSSSPSSTEEEGGKTSLLQTHAKGGSMDDPHFIRIFGRWTSYSRGMNLLLSRDAAVPSLERKPAVEGANAASPGHPDSISVPPPRQPTLFTARMSAARQPRLSHPVLYWRQTITSSPMEQSCIALIKLPVRERGLSDATADPAAATAAEVPDSCEDAQQHAFERRNAASAPDPFWLSCGPELQLSRLAKYLTFSISQEKINKVLAALDYSVEIWEEPHETKHSADESGGGSSSHATKKAQEAAANEQAEVAVPEKQQEASAFRGVEARRLAAVPETFEEAPPKWRVGVCLLNRLKGKEGAQDKKPTGDRGSHEAATATSAQLPGEKPRETVVDKGELELQRDGRKEVNESREGSEKEKQTGNEFSEATLVGELKFHLSPAVASQADDNPQGEPEAIQIRHFIDAGWIYTRYIQGVNVSRFNRLAIKESRGGITQPCVGFWDEHSLLSVAPDAYSWDEATEKGTLRFVFGSALRDGVDNSDALFDAVPGHHPTARMHVCFYPNEEQPFGMFMGEVRFVIDSADATLLVCFILFVFLALPLTCAVALSFHVYKHRNLRERLQRLVLVQQRDAVEQLLMRELGLSTEDQDDANDEDDEEEGHV